MTRFKETMKNIVIVLLLCSILCLTIMALPTSLLQGLPRPLLQALGIRTSPEQVYVPPREITAAAMPLSISVSHAGGRATVRRSGEALEQAYSRLSPYLGQALSASGQWQKAEEADVLAALDGPGVLFSFGGSIPVGTLCLWLTGQEGPDGLSASDFLLSIDRRQAALYLLGSENLCCKADISAAGLQAELEAFTPDGSGFAPKDSSLHPLTLWENAVSLPLYTTENPVSAEFATALAAAMSLNPYDSAYTDPGGNTVFTETHWSLAVDADGLVTVTVTDSDVARFTAAKDAPTEKIELVQGLLDILTRQLPGQQQLQLLSASSSTIAFTYVLDGVPVLPAICTAEFDGPNMTRLTLLLRSFHPAAGSYTLMPISAAAAISRPGSRLLPAYSPAAACGWSVPA